MNRPLVRIESFTTSDESRVEVSSGDVVVIVGPNNSGKTAALRGLLAKVEDPARTNPVVRDVAIGRSGTEMELLDWLEGTSRRSDDDPSNPSYSARGAAVSSRQAKYDWQESRPGLGQLTRFFCHFLTADERLATVNPAPAIAFTQEPLAHPIHYLERDDRLELRLSTQFHRAFGEDLIVHRNAGSQVPLYVGVRPQPEAGEDRVSLGYITKLEALPQLKDQGDGMRSFSGVLLHSFTGEETILLVDEPEAFLHPPQARILGRLLVDDKPGERQLFLATHSADVLRGVLDSQSTKVRVLRLRREGSVNVLTELDNRRIAELWSDPLLRYSNIFDGLFHEGVVLCESDSDCRFYEAMVDALVEREGGRKPDLLFTHCGGKDRMPVVLNALKGMGVPVMAIVDFDVLNAVRPLRDIVAALGGDWARIESDRRSVDSAIRSKKPEKSGEEVAAEIREVLKEVAGPEVPKEVARDIRRLLKKSSPWSIAKTTGTAYVPSGEPTQACVRVLKHLVRTGVSVVPVGELESFARSIGRHGPAWVNRVLERDLRNDPELKAARDFVAVLLANSSEGAPPQQVAEA